MVSQSGSRWVAGIYIAKTVRTATSLGSASWEPKRLFGMGITLLFEVVSPSDGFSTMLCS